MKNYEFIVWLEGYLDVCSSDTLNRKKLYIIKNHLNLVKGVEGFLGEVNTQIYNLISNKLEMSETEIILESENILLELQTIVNELLTSSFPDSYEDKAKLSELLVLN